MSLLRGNTELSVRLLAHVAVPAAQGKHKFWTPIFVDQQRCCAIALLEKEIFHAGDAFINVIRRCRIGVEAVTLKRVEAGFLECRVLCTPSRVSDQVYRTAEVA